MSLLHSVSACEERRKLHIRRLIFPLSRGTRCAGLPREMGTEILSGGEIDF